MTKKNSLQSFIKKASDVNLNTAIAMSKSLKDLEKQNRKKAKELYLTPFHLMKDPIEVKKVLDLRLSNIILQSFQINLIDIVPRHTCKLWDKASLYCDIKPGDLSYDNINLSELMDYYVSALIPYIIPSTYREGDKMLNVSQIVGRERSIIYSNKNESSYQSPHKEVTNDTFNLIEINDSVQLSSKSPEIANVKESEIINEDLNHFSPTNDWENSNLFPENISATPENDLSQCRFLEMFNKDKFSDFIVFLKSETVLYLHKFVLAAWNCNAEYLQDSQQFILNIDDEIVIKLLKHLYSDGKFNIDDIIDSDDCLALCKIFGLNRSLLQKHSLPVPFEPLCKSINTNQIISSNEKELKSLSAIKLPENNCDFSINNILSKSIINLAQSTPNRFTLTNKTSELSIKRSSNYSEKDLFESYDIDFDETTNLVVNNTLEAISNPSVQKIEEPLNNYSLHKKLCSFTNEPYLTNYPDTLTKLSYNNIDQPPDKRNNMEDVLTALPAQPEKNHIIQLSDRNPKIIEENFLSPTFCKMPNNNRISNNEIMKVTEPDLIIPSRVGDSINSEMCEENSDRLFDEIYYQSPISMTFGEEINFNHRNETEITKNNYLQHNSILTVKDNIILEDSPLPLRQRLGLKSLNSDINAVINISSDEELTNHEVKKPNKRSRDKIKTIQSNSRFSTENGQEIKPKRSNTKSITDKLQRKPKKTLSEINIENVPKEPKVKKDKKSRKRKSSETLNGFITPIKQQFLADPSFTPVPDFSAMSTSVIKGKCMNFGIKPNLPKNYKIKILEKVHIYERIKNHSLSSSSNSDSTNVSFKENEESESNDSKDENVVDNLNDNIQLYNFLKATYFRDILTYTPLDIKKVLAELKENNIKTSLKKLNDYFDKQCILHSSEDNKKGTNFSRPIKASKMIL